MTLPGVHGGGAPAWSLAAATGEALRRGLLGARVVVVGLGASGTAAAALCRRLGAEVVGTDAAPREKLPRAAELEGAGATLVLGGHEGAGLERADLVVISPGVPSFPALTAAEARGVPVIGEIELATRLLPDLPVIAITGSNGKSTTTTLVGELLAAAGKRPFVGGNLGDPPAAIVPGPGGTAPPHDVLVLEISSFQAERVPMLRPRAAALLNLSPNHLDRYNGYEAYAGAKGNLFVNQRAEDLAVIPIEDPGCERQARRGGGRIVRFGPLVADVAFDRDRILDGTRSTGAWSFDRRRIRLAGDHNAMNVCAALALVSPWIDQREPIDGVLASFRGLPHRLAFVRELDGVRFYDDSKGTSVGAAVAAIRGLHEAKVVLVAGGRDKMGSYDPLVEAMRDRGRGAVLIGEAADRLAAALDGVVPLARAASMEEAVHAARRLAQPGDAVLLSPACSSFDMFRDYGHRGDAFVDAVVALGE